MEGSPCEPKETVVMKHKEHSTLLYNINMEQGRNNMHTFLHSILWTWTLNSTWKANY